MERKLVRYARAQLLAGRWFDKWHASPYYVVGHAVIALRDHDRELVRTLADCLLAAQRPDGSWGYYGATREETAYCLQALCLHQRCTGRLDRAPLERAAQYLHEWAGDDDPALWIDKCLYNPQRIVQSTILAALWLYKETF